MKNGIMLVASLVLALIMHVSYAAKTVETASPAFCRCQPADPCWPKLAEWEKLNKATHGRLIQPQSFMEICKTNPTSAACSTAIKNSQNPFFLEDQPSATQQSGMFNAWNSAVSPYAVAVENAHDVAAAVNFARKHHLKLVIKGTGHDYLGRSNAPDSLLIWTHKMRDVTLHNNFVPAGCKKPGVSAVTVGAGARWMDVYKDVTVEHGRYVQGGGCTSVGAAGGFMQGGGFGSFSKKFGTGAAGLLEAEIVTADGKILIANACQHSDIFWALRGGGGGTFGVVTKVTLQTHSLPKEFGGVRGTITANTDESFKDLLRHIVRFYRQHLNNEHWGEQIAVNPNNSLGLSIRFQGLTKKEAETVWQPLKTWLAKHSAHFKEKIEITAMPARHYWDYEYLKKHDPDAVHPDDRPGQPKGQYWWAGNQMEVSGYFYHYLSRWIPLTLFDEANAKSFSEMLFKASRQKPVVMHFNKGLAGAPALAIERSKETPMNPAAYQAPVLIIIADGMPDGFPGVQGHEPNMAEVKVAADQMNAAIKIFRDATPGGGAYLNEADYFEPDWQQSFWGTHYPRLLKIKKKYDPKGLFYCHHCVGSERWTKNGMCLEPST